MMVIVATFAVMGVAGTVTWAAVRRWPQAHLTAPQVHPRPTGHRGRLGAVWASRVDPTKATGLALSVAAALVIGGSVGVATVLRMVRRHQGLAELDDTFARWGAHHATGGSTRFLTGLTWFGSMTGVIVVTVVAAALAYRRSPHRALFAFLVLVVAGQLAITNLIKAIVGRERPQLDQLTSFSGPSFPSGHTTAAAACFAAGALVLGRRRSLGAKAVLAGGAAAMATGVAASRVLLGVHWFTDVVAGLLLGWAWFAVGSIVFGGRLLRFGAPAEEAVATATEDIDSQPGESAAQAGSVARGIDAQPG
jgi:membrane-associated phospholipid phosphatase